MPEESSDSTDRETTQTQNQSKITDSSTNNQSNSTGSSELTELIKIANDNTKYLKDIKANTERPTKLQKFIDNVYSGIIGGIIGSAIGLGLVYLALHY